jgi:hypothetical protein
MNREGGSKWLRIVSNSVTVPVSHAPVKLTSSLPAEGAVPSSRSVSERWSLQVLLVECLWSKGISQGLCHLNASAFV